MGIALVAVFIGAFLLAEVIGIPLAAVALVCAAAAVYVSMTLLGRHVGNPDDALQIERDTPKT